MLAIRKDPKAKIVKKEHFDKAMITVRASITQYVLRFYDKISESLGKGIIKKDIKDRDLDVA